MCEPPLTNQTSHRSFSPVGICMSLCTVCYTVFGSTVVDAAVLQECLSNHKREVVVDGVDDGLDVSHAVAIFINKMHHWTSVVVLFVPVHNCSLHRQLWPQAAPQHYCSSWQTYLIPRLQNQSSDTCNIPNTSEEVLKNVTIHLKEKRTDLSVEELTGEGL